MPRWSGQEIDRMKTGSLTVPPPMARMRGIMAVPLAYNRTG
jgi:hypothetical protein